MPNTGPHHAADRSKSRKSDRSNRKTTVGFETPPRVMKPMRPSSRLGPVQSATPTPQRRTFGGIGGGYANDFIEERRRRQLRHAARLAKEPKHTLIVGGVNPFEQRNVGEAIKKFREVVAEKLFSSCMNITVSSKKFNTTKLVFREEEEEEEEDSVIVIAGGGDGGQKRNGTIVIDD